MSRRVPDSVTVRDTLANYLSLCVMLIALQALKMTDEHLIHNKFLSVIVCAVAVLFTSLAFKKIYTRERVLEIIEAQKALQHQKPNQLLIKIALPILMFSSLLGLALIFITS